MPIKPIRVTGKSIRAALSLIKTATGLVADSILGIAGITCEETP